MNNEPVKPSRSLKAGDIISVEFQPVKRIYKVKDLLVKRVSAKIAKDYIEEITPESELEKLRLFHRDPVSVIFGYREKGTGRPTKKERRRLEKIKQAGKN